MMARDTVCKDMTQGLIVLDREHRSPSRMVDPNCFAGYPPLKLIRVFSDVMKQAHDFC